MRSDAVRSAALRRGAAAVDNQPTSEPEAQGWGVGPGWAPCGLRCDAEIRVAARSGAEQGRALQSGDFQTLPSWANMRKHPSSS